MEKLKAFLFTFTLTLSVMLAAYGGLYWYYGSVGRQASGEQQGVPVLTAMADDCKNILTVYRTERADFYLLLQFNAIQDRISIMGIPSQLYLEKPQRTVAESMEYAGVLQCVQDIQQQFEVRVDYYLVCDTKALVGLTEGFADIDTEGAGVPQSVRHYLLKGSTSAEPAALAEAVNMCGDGLDNAVGLEFINLAACLLVRDNLALIKSHSLDCIQDSFSSVNTNIGKMEADKLERIITLLLRQQVQFEGEVAVQDSAQQQTDRLFKG